MTRVELMERVRFLEEENSQLKIVSTKNIFILHCNSHLVNYYQENDALKHKLRDKGDTEDSFPQVQDDDDDTYFSLGTKRTDISERERANAVKVDKIILKDVTENSFLDTSREQSSMGSEFDSPERSFSAANDSDCSESESSNEEEDDEKSTSLESDDSSDSKCNHNVFEMDSVYEAYYVKPTRFLHMKKCAECQILISDNGENGSFKIGTKNQVYYCKQARSKKNICNFVLCADCHKKNVLHNSGMGSSRSSRRRKGLV